VKKKKFLHVKLKTPENILNVTNSAELHSIHRCRWVKLLSIYLQCSQKKSPLRFSEIFSQTDGNFLINFYTPITLSFLH